MHSQFNLLFASAALLSLASAGLIHKRQSFTGATSSAAACPLPSSTGFVPNGDFEDGPSPWTTSVSQGSVQVSVNTDEASYSGCSEVSLVSTSPANQGNRQVTLAVPVSGLNGGGQYIVSLFQGRPTSDSSNSVPTIALTVGQGPIARGLACAGSGCPLEGSGSSVYQEIKVPFTAPAPGFRLTITVTWTDANEAPPVLLDDVSIVAA